MFKRIISTTISLAILLTALSAFPVYADEWSYYETFDSLKTNAVPKSVVVEGSESGRVVEDGKRNKAFCVETGYRDNNITIPLGTVSEKYVVGFDVKIEGEEFPMGIAISDADAKKLELLDYIVGDGLKTKDGKYIGGFTRGSYTRIIIKVDSINGFLSIILNGKAVVKYWPLSAKPKGEISLLIDTTCNEKYSKLFLDNISVNHGDKVINKKKSSAYNTEKIDYIEVDESEIPNKVYFVQDFESTENSLEGINAIAKTNVIAPKNENGNIFLSMDKVTTDDCYIQLQIPETSKNVVWEMDARVTKPGAEIALFWGRDSSTNSTNTDVPFLGMNDMRLRSCSRDVLVMNKEQWYHFAIAMNLSRDTLDLYVDGKKVIEDGSFSKKKFRKLNVLRTVLTSKTGDIQVDNIKIYDGKEPRTIDNANIERESVFQSEDMPLKMLKNKTALQPYAGTKFANDEKVEMAIQPVIDGEDIYISEEDAKDFLPDVIDFSNVKSILTDNKKLYLVSDLVAKTKRYVYDDNCGLFISAEGEFETSEKTVKETNLYMFFKRPDAEQLKSDFVKTNGKSGNVHPRVLVTADEFAKLKKEVAQNPIKKEWYNIILEKADKILNEPGVVYEKADGLRILTISQTVVKRMLNLGFCYNITGDKKYADRAWKEVEAVLAFPDWNAKYHFLDTGEMSFAFAIAYDWFYDAFNDEQKQMIYDATVKNSMTPHLDACYGQLGGDSFWVKTNTNWAVVSHGGVMTAALAMAENDPDFCFKIVQNAFRGIEYMWHEFAPDGAWHEGPGYWGYVMQYSTYMLSTMMNTLGTDYKLTDYKGMSKFSYFIPAIEGSKGNYNFHDSSTGHSSHSEMFWHAKQFNDDALCALRLYYMDVYDIEPSVGDLLWYNTEITSESVDMPKDNYYRALQMITMRSSYNDPEGLFVGFHGAETMGGHNHYDAGSYILELGGVRWGVDLGVEMSCYYVDFSKRGEYYRIRTESHNSVVINPSADPGQDVDGFATIEEYETSDKSAYAIMDLSSDYKESTNSYLRGFMLTDSRRSLTVRDEIDLKEESDLYWFFTTGANIEIVDKNNIILTSDGKQLKIQFVTDANEYSVSVMDAAPLASSPNPSDNSSNSSFKKIAVKIRDKGKLNIAAKFSMLDEPTSKIAVDNTPLDKWQLKDGLADLRPDEDIKAKMLYIDGKPISEYTYQPFDNSKYVYEVTLVNAEGVPTVTADCDGKKYEVINSKYSDGKPYTMVKVFDENGYYDSYVIEYRMLKTSDMDFGKYERHVVFSSSCSSMPEPQNRDVHTYDGLLETRWSANGDGEWLIQDLGESKGIDAIAVAFLNGSKRSTTFDILVSDDGKTFKNVISTSSSGTTDDYEILQLETSVNARYIKFVGHGNTVNTWNSVTEFGALKLK